MSNSFKQAEDKPHHLLTAQLPVVVFILRWFW